jgi:hypothetical protein
MRGMSIDLSIYPGGAGGRADDGRALRGGAVPSGVWLAPVSTLSTVDTVRVSTLRPLSTAERAGCGAPGLAARGAGLRARAPTAGGTSPRGDGRAALQQRQRNAATRCGDCNAATGCNTLQQAATRCNRLQHAAARRQRMRWREPAETVAAQRHDIRRRCCARNDCCSELRLGPCHVCGYTDGLGLAHCWHTSAAGLGAPEMTQCPASYGKRSRLNFCRICDVPPAPSTRRRRGPQQPAEREGGRKGPGVSTRSTPCSRQSAKADGVHPNGTARFTGKAHTRSAARRGAERHSVLGGDGLRGRWVVLRVLTGSHGYSWVL